MSLQLWPYIVIRYCYVLATLSILFCAVRYCHSLLFCFFVSSWYYFGTIMHCYALSCIILHCVWLCIAMYLFLCSLYDLLSLHVFMKLLFFSASGRFGLQMCCKSLASRAESSRLRGSVSSLSVGISQTTWAQLADPEGMENISSFDWPAFNSGKLLCVELSIAFLTFVSNDGRRTSRTFVCDSLNLKQSQLLRFDDAPLIIVHLCLSYK